MNKKQIEIILQSGKHWKLIETHISYVLLGPSLVFKIKKNIKYSFLDFSTLQKRKYFCERELFLNNRLSSGIYLKVVPVKRVNDKLIIDGKSGTTIDYAVKMKRLQAAKQMHLMLDKNQVTKKHIQSIALLIRNFHQGTSVINNKFNPNDFTSRFNDILSIVEFIKSSVGTEQAKIITKAVYISDIFLKTHHDLFEHRAANGFIRDCHGDLHSRNIFLYQKPIVFDCIEFNDSFRQTDVLDELAFFCMDLEAEGYYELSKAFTGYYFGKSKKEFGIQEQLLFTYYKCYRANVRAKVNALRAMQSTSLLRKKNLEDVNKYLVLMDGYLEELS
jgi:aminoglycoside phosphotransferase family enzyme